MQSNVRLAVKQPSAAGFHTYQPVKPMIFRNQNGAINRTTDALMRMEARTSPPRFRETTSEGDMTFLGTGTTQAL